MTQLLTMKLNRTTGLGTLTLGQQTLRCGGKPGFDYPADTTINASDRKGTVKSREYDATMPYAVLWIGQRGVYFHEWPNLEASSGCIHLLPGDAQTFYEQWITRKTRIVFSWTN
ncbi:MAG: hypothetical protein EZS28_004234 [Streblomastix strix]|uniref:L,D-TPase catalytic domain-containing protein n=1 Tax=Streblomastix strix TaxID=222440 RepID=A0A5J4WZ94_9EUKA|nr:MAG: hypothetical protein EZS28_004234 [Streblomastix strix]